MTRILAISSAYGGCAAALGGLHAETRQEIGLAAALPTLIENLLLEAGSPPDLVAVIVGPGSFTGLRAGISVALGVGLALGIPTIGVTVAEALAAAIPNLAGRTLWTAIQSRRGTVFIDKGEGFQSWPAETLPPASTPVALCGNAAIEVAARLAARGDNVRLTDARAPTPEHTAQVARRRHAGELPPLAAEPLYVDAPAASTPAGGLRGAPI